MYIIHTFKILVKNYFSVGIKKPHTWAGFKECVLIRTSSIVHQLPVRACLREQKSYSLKVFVVSNAFGVPRC